MFAIYLAVSTLTVLYLMFDNFNSATRLLQVSVYFLQLHLVKNVYTPESIALKPD